MAVPRRKPRRRPGRPSGDSDLDSRKALLSAARGLMAERGIPGVTLREVAERAGVQPALIHYYFGGKTGLLRAVVADVAGRTVAHIREGAARGDSAAERLRSLVASAMLGLAEDPYAPRLVVEQVLFGEEEVAAEFAERFARRNLEEIRSVIEDGRRDGELREVDPVFLMSSLLGSCIFFMLAGPVVKRFLGVDEITPELARRFADHAVEVTLQGILAPTETNP